MRFLSFEELKEKFQNKRVALVGSGPSVLLHSPGYVDSYDLVVRVNNFKLGNEAGYKVDAHYSFYGASILQSKEFLKKVGVNLCICKCPNSKPIDSRWHVENGKMRGIDFRYIYDFRKNFWFCDTFVPDDKRFVTKFEILQRHIPTTGFAAILDLLACKPDELYITGFDFFKSGIHNVNERWRQNNKQDPIGHDAEKEMIWLIDNRHKYPITVDGTLLKILEENSKYELCAN